MSDDFRCPTCGARQRLAAECRRCKCDLTLVAQQADREQEAHEICLREMRAGRMPQALQAALRRWELSPDAVATRLVGVCCLLSGRNAAALQVYEASRSRQ